MPGRHSRSSSPLVVCLYEDRPSAFPGVQLAVLSLRRHMPQAALVATLPGLPRAHREWLAQFENVTLTTDDDLDASGWDVKPSLLLRRLGEGHQRVVWWDADVMATRPIGDLLDGPDDVLVSTEEMVWGQLQGSRRRTAAWGLVFGRALPTTINTAIVSVTAHHTQLLLDWKELLARDEYRAAQGGSWDARPLHLLGDQEVLTALLGSQPHAGCRLRLLRTGVDIAHCFGPGGFSATERMRALRTKGGPPLVHATTPKPWQVLSEPIGRPKRLGDLRRLYGRSHARLSPYTTVARRHRDALPDPQPWLDTSRPVRLMLRLPGDPMITAELPIALFDGIVRAVRRRLGIGRFSID